MALIELEDTSWFPNILRDQQLGYIGWLVQFIDLYRPIRKLLATWITASRSSTVFDLCSGSGEPMVSISKSFSSGTDISLSDKFPPEDISRFRSMNYIHLSVDVLSLEVEPNRYYTMFNAFHHFDDSEQTDIVDRLSRAHAPFCFVEILQPSFFTLIKVIFINTIGQLILAPFVRPFSWKRLLLTYIIPINLITTTYDGIISVLKSKNKSQYQTLLSNISSDDYQIDISTERAPYSNHLTIIRGRPLK